MYDREKDERFYMYDMGTEEDTTSDPQWWEGHEPIWITATKQGEARCYSRVQGQRQLVPRSLPLKA